MTEHKKHIIKPKIGIVNDDEKAFVQNSFDEMTDKQLWKTFRNGQDEVLSFIYRTYVDMLFNFGCQLTSDRELVKDSIQDLFINLKRSKGHNTEITSIKSYLFKSLFRLINKGNKSFRNLLSVNKLKESDFSISIPIETKLIEGEVITKRINYVKTELNRLSLKQRQAVIHYFYDGLTYGEIAEIMEMKSGDAVRMLIYRGLDKIKEKVIKHKLFLIPALALISMLLLKIFF